MMIRTHMMPFSLRFTEQQIKALDRIRKRTGTPTNEIIRRFIDEGIARFIEANRK